MERHRLPAVMPTAPRSASLPNDNLKAAELWARAYVAGHDTAELERALAVIEQLPEAHQPFVSYARTAYLKLTAELAKRAGSFLPKQ